MSRAFDQQSDGILRRMDLRNKILETFHTIFNRADDIPDAQIRCNNNMSQAPVGWYVAVNYRYTNNPQNKTRTFLIVVGYPTEEEALNAAEYHVFDLMGAIFHDRIWWDFAKPHPWLANYKPLTQAR